MQIIPIKPNLNIKTFHIDGLGCRRSGTGSAYGWIRIETGVQRIRAVNGLTEQEAEYQALLAVLKYLAPGSRATIFTHSHDVWGAFNDVPVRDPQLARLFSRTRRLIREKKLKIRIRYVLRDDNQSVIVPGYRGEEDSDGDLREPCDAGDEGDADFS